MIAGPSGIGAPSAGINATIALRGTVPVTSERVAAGATGAGDAAGVLDPHAEVIAAATITMNVVERMNPDGSMAALRMDATSLWILGLAAVIAGGIASIAGFGIGSVLTPTLSIWIDAKLAVAAISIPHFIGTAWRFWLLQGRVDRRALWSFGIPSAVGGLAGAVLHNVATSPSLLVLLAVLLLFVAASEVTGFSRRMVFRGPAAWMAGALSGVLGGLVGNQGGLRAGGLLGFQMDRHTFVATATAIGLLVDAARLPVYLAVYARELSTVLAPITVSTVGVVIGTIVGGRVLGRIPDHRFRRVVAVLLAVLGIWLLSRV